MSPPVTTDSLFRRIDRAIARGTHVAEGEKATVNRLIKNFEAQGGRLTRAQFERLRTTVRRIEGRSRRQRGRKR